MSELNQEAEYHTPAQVAEFLGDKTFEGLGVFNPQVGTLPIPPGADGTEPAKDGPSKFYTFCGMTLHRFAVPGKWTKIIGKRTVEGSDPQTPVRVYEILVTRKDAFDSENTAQVTLNGEHLFTIQAAVNFSNLEKMAVSALHRLLHGSRSRNKRKHARAKAKKAAK